jgi:hypothetical protein
VAQRWESEQVNVYGVIPELEEELLTLIVDRVEPASAVEQAQNDTGHGCKHHHGGEGDRPHTPRECQNPE